jgi:NADH:ubiquinone oxidoreductase subunit K
VTYAIAHFLILSAVLLSTGLAIVITKRNAIMMLIGIELMLNASNVNLIAFNMMFPQAIAGQMFALFVIIVAVCETAVGLAIILRIYRFYNSSIPDEITDLKG